MNEVQLNDDGFGGIPKRDFVELFKRVMLVFPLGWNSLFKALHFGESAKERYNMAPRAGERRGGLPVPGSYTAKKLRIYGHQRALEFTGRGKAETMSMNDASVQHHSGGGYTARARVSNIFNLRNPQGRTNPPEEITAVLAAENNQLDTMSQAKLDAELRRRSDVKGFVS